MYYKINLVATFLTKIQGILLIRGWLGELYVRELQIRKLPGQWGKMCTLLKVPILLCTESALGLKIHGATSIIVITTKQDLSFTWLIGAK